MRAMIWAAAIAAAATPAGAQLIGGGAHVGAGVGVGAVGSTAGAGAVGSTVDGVGADAAGAARATTGAVRATTSVPTDTARAAAKGDVVRVRAGARVRATRETRCYDGTDYYDPWYDGSDYYCVSRGPGAAVSAGVGHQD